MVVSPSPSPLAPRYLCNFEQKMPKKGAVGVKIKTRVWATCVFTPGEHWPQCWIRAPWSPSRETLLSCSKICSRGSVGAKNVCLRSLVTIVVFRSGIPWPQSWIRAWLNCCQLISLQEGSPSWYSKMSAHCPPPKKIKNKKINKYLCQITAGSYYI